MQEDSVWVSLLRSYIYWKKAYLQQGKKMPVNLHDFKQRYSECPVCRGDTPTWVHDHIFCLCKTMHLLSIPRSGQSPMLGASLQTLVPLRTGNGDSEAARDLNAAKAYITAWLVEPTKWILITGGTGSGKTHILRAIKSSLPSNLTHYITSADLFAKLMAAVGENTIPELIDQIVSAPILLLDDFGAEHTKDFFLDTIMQIIDRRYSLASDYPVVITTNMDPSELISSSNIRMNRIGSRMMDGTTSKVIYLSQGDYRIFGGQSARRPD